MPVNPVSPSDLLRLTVTNQNPVPRAGSGTSACFEPSPEVVTRIQHLGSDDGVLRALSTHGRINPNVLLLERFNESSDLV